MGQCLCDKCAALCCRYFALPIDNPTTARDYDDIRWYLCHENVVIFIEEKQWYIGLMARCKHLQPDNRCGIYETRPKVCREYSTENCDYHGGEYNFDVLFTSAEQLQAYAKQKLREQRERRRQRKRRNEKGGNGAGARRRVKGGPALRRRSMQARATGGGGPILHMPVANGNGTGRIALPVLRG